MRKRAVADMRTIQPSTAKEIHIRAVAFQEGDVWVVQGIEYDIVAHAANVSKLPFAFMRAIIENVCITEHLGREPLAGIKPAPRRFRAMFDAATTAVAPVKKQRGPKNLPIADVDIRVAVPA